MRKGGFFGLRSATTDEANVRVPVAPEPVEAQVPAVAVPVEARDEPIAVRVLPDRSREDEVLASAFLRDQFLVSFEVLCVALAEMRVELFGSLLHHFAVDRGFPLLEELYDLRSEGLAVELYVLQPGPAVFGLVVLQGDGDEGFRLLGEGVAVLDQGLDVARGECPTLHLPLDFLHLPVQPVIHLDELFQGRLLIRPHDDFLGHRRISYPLLRVTSRCEHRDLATLDYLYNSILYAILSNRPLSASIS